MALRAAKICHFGEASVAGMLHVTGAALRRESLALIMCRAIVAPQASLVGHRRSKACRLNVAKAAVRGQHGVGGRQRTFGVHALISR